jgi:hypothetical protein
MRRLAIYFVLTLFISAIVDTAIAAITHNRLASNRLASNRLASNRLASNRLASNRLSANHLEATEDAAELLATADGRELYFYLMSCALPPDLSIQANVPGAPDSNPESPEPATNTPYTCTSGVCTFPGNLGLAPKWIDRKLNRKGQRWISACLFARVNAFDTAEAISLRGKHDALAISVSEAETFTLEEGAFYGQYFVEEGEPIAWYACLGEDESGGEAGGLHLRECAEPDPEDPTLTTCGFNYTGVCRDYVSGVLDPYACRTFDEGYYEKCYVAPGAGKWPMTKKYKEVITVFVSNL